MISLKFSLLPILCLSDELYWVDYDTSLEYNWQRLKSTTDYTVETLDFLIYFNLGTDVKQTCQGQSASAVAVSKSGDYCAILGRHEIVYLIPFNEKEGNGIIIFYEGGSMCKNNYLDEFRHRLEIRLTCSEQESDFYISADASLCTTIVEKFSKSGCSKVYEMSLTTKFVLFLTYAILAMMLIWICIESFNEDFVQESTLFAKNKIISNNSKEKYDPV